jgi:hypothetical protein
MKLEEHFDAAAIEAELEKCLTARGPIVHQKFMRIMAVHQLKATLITNQLLEELITHNGKDTTGGSY